MVKLNVDWDNIIGPEFSEPYYLKLREFLRGEYNTRKIYPAAVNIFNALKTTPFEKLKVVILGQDPYHEEGQAHGLCFSVPEGIALPPSLCNIYKELNDDLGIPSNKSGDLTKWAEQGVLLLNTVLTVRAGAAASHRAQGWESFTDKIISTVNASPNPIVFILWGGHARSKKILITNRNHLIIESAHPSPLSAYNGFFGSKPFSRCNNFLISKNIKPIDWSL